MGIGEFFGARHRLDQRTRALGGGRSRVAPRAIDRGRLLRRQGDGRGPDEKGGGEGEAIGHERLLAVGVGQERKGPWRTEAQPPART